MDRAVAVITGAAGGIGAATAVALAERNADLVLGDRDEVALERAAQAATQNGASTIAVPCDVTRPEECQRLADVALERFGKIDLLFANAGIAEHSRVANGDPDRWRSVLEVNLLGAALSARAVLPHMMERAAGHIILTASVSGRVAYVGEPMYLASKWGLIGLGHSLRKEVSSSGVRVSIIEPGLVMSPLTRDNPAVKHVLEASEPLLPEDVARAVIYVWSQPEHVVVSELTIRPLRQPELESTVI